VRWKQSLTPLDKVPHLDEATREQLVRNHITTAEELVGQIEAEPGPLGELLGLDDAHLRALRERAAGVIDPEVAAAMAAQRGREHPLGALPPKNASP
jgi:hypothetical protein